MYNEISVPENTNLDSDADVQTDLQNNSQMTTQDEIDIDMLCSSVQRNATGVPNVLC